mgnify:CR=1 FL=1|tara:strand:+ start:405 stop:584 length:180 start_codon:yes stop_codon:yes gene_type:complete
MNQRSVKRLKKLINPQDETTKKVYRRLKKSWAKLHTKEEKENFFEGIEDLINKTNIQKL